MPGKAMRILLKASATSSHKEKSYKHWVYRTFFFFIKETITKPPPKVQALNTNIERNNVHSLL